MDEAEKFPLTDREFNIIRALVREHTGISLSEAKRDMVYSRLAKRLRKLKLKSFDTYCKLLQDNGHPEELAEFTNAITTNLTSFFREQHHFDYLVKKLLPYLLEKKSQQKKIRIWSAGCSTGEEPYTLAMMIKETHGISADWDIKILATDLNTNVLEKAKIGVYEMDRLMNVNPRKVKRWFTKGKGENSGMVKVVSELKDMITFKQLNLMGDWPFKGPFDIIFCRNVIIYFDKRTQKGLIDRYANVLDTDGHLFLGHSETLYKVTDRFELLGNTIYLKNK